MALRLQDRLGSGPPPTMRRSTTSWPICGADRRAQPRQGAGAVRAGARPARRHADRHDPRLLPIAAPPLPARGRDLAALPAGRGRATPRLTMEGARESVLADASPARAARTSRGSPRPEQFGVLVQKLDAQRERLAPLLGLPEPALAAAVRRAAGPRRPSEAALLSAAVTWPAEAEVRARASARRTRRARRACATMRGRMLGLARAPAPSCARRTGATGSAASVQKNGDPRAALLLRGQEAGRAAPEIHALMARRGASACSAVEDSRRTLRMAEATPRCCCSRPDAARLRQAQARSRVPRLRRPDRPHLAPAARPRARPGCSTSSTAASITCCWTRCRTPRRSSGQIAHRLTEEFFAGLGARAAEGAPGRTFFAVGDPKQSIYSFQGADRDEFDRSRAPDGAIASATPASRGGT